MTKRKKTERKKSTTEQWAIQFVRAGVRVWSVSPDPHGEQESLLAPRKQERLEKHQTFSCDLLSCLETRIYYLLLFPTNHIKIICIVVLSNKFYVALEK